MDRIEVLIVDDTKDSADTLYQLVLAAGFKAERAYSAAAGLEIASRHQPKVAILDLEMPQMDGVTLSRAIAALPQLAHPPRFIALSGNTEEEWRRRTSAAGFVAHLTKPVCWLSLEELLARQLKSEDVSYALTQFSRNSKLY